MRPEFRREAWILIVATVAFASWSLLKAEAEGGNSTSSAGAALTARGLAQVVGQGETPLREAAMGWRPGLCGAGCHSC
jgi:hypothetical protein